MKPAYKSPEQWLGSVRFLAGVMESLAKHHTVTGIFHIGYKGTLQHNGVTYMFPGYSGWQLFFPLGFHHYLKKLRPDAVIVHGLKSPWQVLMLKFQLGSRVKIILQHHAERPYRDFRKYIQSWADRHVFAYLFASRELGLQWVNQKQINDRGKIKEIMGTSSPFAIAGKDVARRATNVKGEKIFLWVGRLDANKDPMTVIKAFSELVKTEPSARLYMIYQTFGLLEEVAALVDLNGATDHINLVGRVDHSALQDWYNSADFIISSSLYEGSGIAVCEALSCGCIPIVTDIPSFRMMTGNGTVGLLFEAGNSDSLLEMLHRSFMLDIPAERDKVLRQFKNELSFDANARKIMRVIEEVPEP